MEGSIKLAAKKAGVEKAGRGKKLGTGGPLVFVFIQILYFVFRSSSRIPMRFASFRRWSTWRRSTPKRSGSRGPRRRWSAKAWTCGNSWTRADRVPRWTARTTRWVFGVLCTFNRNARSIENRMQNYKCFYIQNFCKTWVLLTKSKLYRLFIILRLGS